MDLEPIDTTGTNVLKLAANYKAPPDGQLMLVPVPFGKCGHWNTTFEVDLKGGKCKCLGCGDDVSPMFVLETLMNKESRWMRTRTDYVDEMKRLAERERTTCQHCKKMTRISRA
jgi:hypothetical protein